jgi:hypothetical protein
MPTLELSRRVLPQARPQPPNHGANWTREQEDQLLQQFREGFAVGDIALSLGRTVGSINARLAQLLGVSWPDTPVMYRDRGGVIARREERRAARRPALWPEVRHAPPQSIWYDFGPPDQVVEQRPSRVYRSTVVAPPPAPPAAPVEEVPDQLKAKLSLHKAQYQALAETIRSMRPAHEGRVAAGQQSVLNQLTYKLAALFEGEGSTFNRAKWLEACGVTQGN